MSVTLSASLTALGPGRTSSFLANGGTEPYTYEVLPNGAGGTIDPGSGDYTAPTVLDPAAKPGAYQDVIQATDSLGATGTLKIIVGDPLLLVCEIIQREMNLADGRVYIWDQKLMQPTDSGLYIAVGVVSSKPFGNTNRQSGSTGGFDEVQSVNVLDNLSIDVISRGPEARTRKEEVLFALNSNYSESQQEANSFFVGRLPAGGQFVNLSDIDGAAIPYRFRISINLQYFKTNAKAVPYFDSPDSPSVVTES